MIYIVVWSGGYEAPSYAAHNSEKEAFKQAKEWWNDADAEVDSVDVLAIDIKTLQVKRLEQHRKGEPWFPPVNKEATSYE